MITRRTLIGSASAMLAGAVLSQAQTPQQGGRKIAFTHDVPDIDMKNWAVTVVEVSYGPGDKSEAHRHPGITIAYVLEGEIRSKVGDGPEQNYTAGQVFVETPNQLHAVSRNASGTKPAKLLAVMLAEKGKALTVPA
jgi:quercetin dioxygenase-like cupin family protein